MSQEKPAGEAAVGDVRWPWFWAMGRGICRLATTFAFDLKAIRTDQVPVRGGVLLVSNHQSFLDPVLLALPLRRPVSFFAKAELFENRYFGWLIRELNAFPVRRGEADVGALKEAVRRLKSGRVVTVFPEGTRTKHGGIGPILPGIAMIVRRAGVPVVPAVVDGAHEAWPRGRKLPRPWPVRVLYGKPQDLSKMKPGAMVEWIDRSLRGLLDELRSMKL